MSFLSRLLTAVLGLGLIWFLWPFGGGSDEVVKTIEPPTGHQGRLFTTPMPDDRASPAPREATPADAEAADADAAETDEDEESVAVLSPGAVQGPTPKLKSIRFYRIKVLDGGTLETRGNIVIKLKDIDVYPADKTCKDAQGSTWACGTRARMALTRLIRGRAVICKVPANVKAVTARCRLGGTDLSTWMVAQGWAKPAGPAEPKLVRAAEAAQKRKIGVWR